MNLGQRLLKIMRARGITQDELAHAVGCTQATITKIINNKAAGSKFLISIARELNCDPHWLESGKGINPESKLNGDEKTNTLFPWIPPDTIPLLSSQELTSLIISHTEPEKGKFIKPPFEVENRYLIAWTIDDDSMFSSTTRAKPYVPGEIIIIDREVIHFSGDLVVVIRRDRVLFRKLIHDGTKQVLVAENPIYPKIDYISMDDENEENCIFCGTVISSVFENKR